MWLWLWLCSCSCGCADVNDADDDDVNDSADAEDDHDAAANEALAQALSDAAALNAAEAELEADYSVPEVVEASVVSPQLPDPGHALVCAKDVLAEAALVTPDVAAPLMAASASTPAVPRQRLPLVSCSKGFEAAGSPDRSQCDEAVKEAATFTGQMAQLEAAGQAAMQNLVSDAVVNTIEDAGERNLAELNAVMANANVVSDFFDDPEGPQPSMTLSRPTQT